MSTEDNELDPRIRIELDNLNAATDEINRLEIELEEANSTFRILLNESTRRLKLSSKKLGSCIEKSRPYYEAMEKAREAQIECQKAAVKFQRANEIHAAAKETVALAEQRFMSNSHEWQFDNAWQEMLNHATQKVMDAEKQKAECHAEHQKRTKTFNVAEKKVQQLEERYRRNIAKSRPYFEEKQICQDQLQTQKNRIEELQQQVQLAKKTYANALRNLERISNDIHRKRGDFSQISQTPPPGPREPGVGAELNSPTASGGSILSNFHLELEKCDKSSINDSQMSLDLQVPLNAVNSANTNMTTKNIFIQPLHSTVQSNCGECDIASGCNPQISVKDESKCRVHDVCGAGHNDENDVDALRQKVKFLAIRPVEAGDGQHEQNDVWEHELKATVDKLDHLLMVRESIEMRDYAPSQYDDKNKKSAMSPNISTSHTSKSFLSFAHDPESSSPNTPHRFAKPLKKLLRQEPLPLINVSMRELPLLSRISNEVNQQNSTYCRQRRRSLE